MRKFTLSFFILLSINIYGQKSSHLDNVDAFAKDSIFEIPMYIPILDSEQDSIRYSYKIISLDTSSITLDDSTIVKEVPFTPIKVTKANFPEGDEKLIDYIYHHLKPVFFKNSGINKKNYTTGYTTVRFKISRAGEISNVKIVKSSFQEYDGEIEKSIKILPKFIPASARGVSPEFYCILSVKYPYIN